MLNPRMQILFKSLLAVFLTLTTCLIIALCAEIYFQYTSKYDTTGIQYHWHELWRWRKNLNGNGWNNELGTFKVMTDSKGFRNEDKDYKINKQVIRILVIGDSYTAGLHNTKENIFTTLLEKGLVEKGNEIEVYNMACPAWGTEQEYLCLLDDGLQIKPDYLLLMTCPNDIRETYCKRFAELKDGKVVFNANPFKKGEIQLWKLANYSRLYQYLQKEVFKTEYGSFSFLMSNFSFNFGREDSASWDRPLFLKHTFKELDDAYSLYYNLVDSIHLRCTENNIQFAISCIPFSWEYDSTMVKDTTMQSGIVSDKINAFCQSRHIDYVNLNKVFDQQPAPQSLFIENDGHFTTQGFKVTGNVLTDYYSEKLKTRIK